MVGCTATDWLAYGVVRLLTLKNGAACAIPVHFLTLPFFKTILSSFNVSKLQYLQQTRCRIWTHFAFAVALQTKRVDHQRLDGDPWSTSSNVRQFCRDRTTAVCMPFALLNHSLRKKFADQMRTTHRHRSGNYKAKHVWVDQSTRVTNIRRAHWLWSDLSAFTSWWLGVAADPTLLSNECSRNWRNRDCLTRTGPGCVQRSKLWRVSYTTPRRTSQSTGILV